MEGIMEGLLSTVHKVLILTPTRWESMAKYLPTELFIRKPAPKEWSAQECLQHMIDTEQVLIFRLHAFLAGQDLLPAFDPERQGTKLADGLDPVELVARFTQMRKDSLSVLEIITPVDLDRKSRHAELGIVSLREMLNEWAAHDLNHTIQAERAIMQTFIRDCGPWQPYFSDHWINAE
jgi:hypothetical protein